MLGFCRLSRFYFSLFSTEPASCVEHFYKARQKFIILKCNAGRELLMFNQFLVKKVKHG